MALGIRKFPISRSLISLNLSCSIADISSWRCLALSVTFYNKFEICEQSHVAIDVSFITRFGTYCALARMLRRIPIRIASAHPICNTQFKLKTARSSNSKQIFLVTGSLQSDSQTHRNFLQRHRSRCHQLLLFFQFSS